MTHVTLEGDFNGAGARIAIVVGRFNGYIVESLLSGALDTLERHHVQRANIAVARVPGAFEIPLVAKRLANSGDYDGVLALGAVIRGATPHFDYVAGECASGLARIAVDSDTPIGFGVLTVDTIEQAVERAGTKAGNKGAEAASALLEMINLLKKIS